VQRRNLGEADLIAEPRERLPRTALADKVIEAIASGARGE
jgi:hypothetical protein